MELGTFCMSQLLQFFSHQNFSYLQSVKCTGPLYRSKFMKAWRKLKPDAVPSSPSITDRISEIRHIVVSSNEQAAIQKMMGALSNIEQLLEHNLASQAKLTADTQRISSQIESTFGEYIAKLTERAMALQEQLRTRSRKQADALKQQQENLQKMRQSVESGLESQNTMLIDTKIDDTKRESKIEEITNNLLSAIEENGVSIEAPDLVFLSDDDAVSKVLNLHQETQLTTNIFIVPFQLISSIGSLSERPDPPTLHVLDISQTAATIRFYSEYDSVVYSFRYRRETGDNDDEKESEWIEQVLDDGVDQFMLNGLHCVSRYELCGKLMKDNVSSFASDIKSFQTLDYPPPPRKDDSLKALPSPDGSIRQTVVMW